MEGERMRGDRVEEWEEGGKEGEKNKERYGARTALMCARLGNQPNNHKRYTLS